MNIAIRSVSTKDVKIVQKALETIRFQTVKEGDCIEAYWVESSVPEKFAHGECRVKLSAGMTEEKEVDITW